jgi:hypothetical protein
MCGDEAAAARSMLQITYPVCQILRQLGSFGLMLVPSDGERNRQALG